MTLLVGARGLDMPAIVEAAKDADWPEVSALIDQGVDVNAAYGDGTTALHWASYWDDLATVDLLLEAGADANAVTDLGVTALWVASENGSGSVVESLLRGGADPRSALRSGETLVMTAARTGSVDIVRDLLSAGADPNAAAARGQTALMWAAGEGHGEVVRLLLEYGADVNARSIVRTQYMKSDKEQESHSDYQGWFEQGGNTALMFAARAGDLASTRAMVEAGADVNQTGAFGISPAIMAIHAGRTGLLEYLLREGAETESASAGYTALHAAILHGNEEAVRLMLAYGADVAAGISKATPTRRQSDDYHFHDAFVGATPLWLAARFGEPNVMRMLLDQGADPSFVHECTYPAGNRERQYIEDEGRITVLMAAVGMCGRRLSRGFYRPRPQDREAVILESVTTAVEAGVDVTAQNADGQTALGAATDRGYDPVVSFLSGLGGGARE